MKKHLLFITFVIVAQLLCVRESVARESVFRELTAGESIVGESTACESAVRKSASGQSMSGESAACKSASDESLSGESTARESQSGNSQTLRHYLSGTDKDNTVQWDFMCTSGRNSNRWTKIPVPSCWEMQGFGTFYYGWEEPETSAETGFYRYSFKADKIWQGQHVEIVFEGSMTDTEVKINGIPAGEPHEGGFYQFSYDITHLLQYGKKNLLEVKVTKCPANKTIYNAERQTDFWLFGGIYRSVFLEINPQQYIQSVAIDARMDGNITVRPYLSAGTEATQVSMYVEELDGTRVSDIITAPAGADLHTQVNRVTPWNQEQPYLYRVVTELKKDNQLLHRVSGKTGFRTVEFRERDGFYLNGQRIIFKGVNRHCFWPESGRTLSRQISLNDALLVKSMNMNAVRMAHYPPDKDFLEICDSLGLLVINELCSWQKKYDTPTARRLVKSMVERDRNHPSIILWANGNEGGWNTDVDDDYLFYDLQQRFVMHPWERFRGTDTKHYPDYNYVVNSTIYDSDVYFPTEFMHGLFDGGNAASLKDFWEVMMKHRAPAGGFLWALLDEGVVRADEGGRIDCKGNLAPDGIVGPYREKEGSYYAVKEIWSPIQVLNRTIPGQWDGNLLVENQYMFTDLAACKLTYRLSDIQLSDNGNFTEKVVAENALPPQELKPGERRLINLSLPAGWQQYDILSFTVTDPHGYELHTWSWPVTHTETYSVRPDDTPSNTHRSVLEACVISSYKGDTSPVTVGEDDDHLYVTHRQDRFVFVKNTGLLERVETPTGHISLNGGPVVVTSANTLEELTHYYEGDTCIVEPRFTGGQWTKWIFAPNRPPRFDYNFQVKGETDFIGIGLNYPEEKIQAMEWIGEGPYRVWKNRMEGTRFGCWQKKYNNTVTGESWEYPEFKGYHADCRAVTLHTTEGRFTMIPSVPGLFFQMLKPLRPQADENGNTAPPFPETNIGFMHAIPPIGTKFQKPEQLGPSGQKNMQLNWAPIKGSLWFLF